MAVFTKIVIMRVFEELLAFKQLDKITVKDITDKCGISRNTFYYHYQDIYQVFQAYIDYSLNEIFKFLQQEKEKTVDIKGTYPDGRWEGGAKGFGGMITVLVTVENGTISEIEITSADDEDKAYLSMAEDIIPKIIEAQSADVDTVSGATFSSTGIRDAVSEALKQAEQ